MDAKANKERELCRDMQAVMKFYCLRGKSSSKSFVKMKCIYSDDCLSRTQVFVLHKEFLEGRETVELRSSQHNGQPSTLMLILLCGLDYNSRWTKPHREILPCRAENNLRGT